MQQCAKKYEQLLDPDTALKKVPVVMALILNLTSWFPQVASHS